MRGIQFIFIIFILLLSSCHKDDLNENVGRKKIVLLYAEAQNSLGSTSESENSQSFFQKDSLEILHGCRQLSSSDTLIAFVDNDNGTSIYAFYKDCQRPTLIKKYATNKNASDPATLQEFLEWANKNYGSRITGLCLWSHANGWLPSTNTNYYSKRYYSFGIDTGFGGDSENNRDKDGRLAAQLSIQNLAKAIKNSGIHFNYLLFDACLMQTLEADYELKNVTDYIVASPISINVNGGYYTRLLPTLFNDNPVDIAKRYYSSVTSTRLSNVYKNYGIVISTVKTSELDSLANVTKKLITKKFANKYVVKLENVLHYYPYGIASYNLPHFYDAKAAMHKLFSAEELTEWLQQFQKTVISCDASSTFIIGPNDNDMSTIDKNECGGVSMFIPLPEYDDYAYRSLMFGNLNKTFHSTTWYTAAGWNTTEW